MFIELKIAEEACRRAGACRLCLESCPVDIFLWVGDRVVVDTEKEDECTLCDLCLLKCPTKAITLHKLY